MAPGGLFEHNGKGVIPRGERDRQAVSYPFRHRRAEVGQILQWCLVRGTEVQPAFGPCDGLDEQGFPLATSARHDAEPGRVGPRAVPVESRPLALPVEHYRRFLYHLASYHSQPDHGLRTASESRSMPVGAIIQVPPSIELTSLRSLSWSMAQLLVAGVRLNLLSLEAPPMMSQPGSTVGLALARTPLCPQQPQTPLRRDSHRRETGS